MDIVINLQPLLDFFNRIGNLSPDVLAVDILTYFGWIPIVWVFIWGAKEVWMGYRQEQWAEKNSASVFLAIDIPMGNEQSPRAVENLFGYLGGAHGSINLIETYWEGKWQLYFSFEIVSIGGYTQFVIKSPLGFRDLVESAIYAQYPDAEITEIDDYTEPFKDVRFPSEKYDLAGAEFILENSQVFPIRTYKDFEHQFGEPETNFRDPMAALMDLCSSLRPSENLWFQILVRPMTPKWPEEVEQQIAKIFKEKIKPKANYFHVFLDGIMAILSLVGTVVFGKGEEMKVEKKSESLKMMDLKPSDQRRVEAMHEKTAKVPYEVKLRMVYLAEKDSFKKGKVFSGFVGFMKQFSALDSNGLKPDMDKTGVSASYFFKEKHINSRKNKIFRNYINRSMYNGRKHFLMSVEELATLWHFPIEASVKAPLIQKAPGRKAEPPMTLPQGESSVSEEKSEPLFFGGDNENGEDNKGNENIFLEETEAKEEVPIEEELMGNYESVEIKGTPPPNLPIC